MKNKLNWKINNAISADEVRVISDKEGQLGVMKTKEAIKLAQEKGVDLIEIAPNANPPVAKLIDFGKFRYQEQKKLRAQLKKQKASELKEVRFSPFIGEADYQTRLKRLNEFLSENNKIKVVVVFKGRQMGSKKFGYELIDRIMNDLGRERIAIDMEPKFTGRHLASVISPLSKQKQDANRATHKNKSAGGQEES